MVQSPNPKDPEGTDSVSERENKERHNKVARQFLNLPPPKTDDPEGTQPPKESEEEY